jgi:hypothetical protein
MNGRYLIVRRKTKMGSREFAYALLDPFGEVVARSTLPGMQQHRETLQQAFELGRRFERLAMTAENFQRAMDNWEL